MSDSDTGTFVHPAVREPTRQRVASLLAIGGDLPKQLRALAKSLQRELAYADSAFTLLVGDLHAQGWRVLPHGEGFLIEAPASAAAEGETIASAKERARNALLVGRESQLREPAVREFLEDLQTPRNGHSIADLIDDGARLSNELAAVAALSRSERANELRKLVAPVVQVIGPADKCPTTGIRLTDAWRYFRHLWSLEYRATPGRTLQVLIRNAARPNAPIMAIASLSSALPQLTLREEWLGWAPPALLAALRNEPSSWPHHRERLLRVVCRAREEVRSDDFEDALRSESAESALLAIAESANAARTAQLEDRRRGVEGVGSVRALPRGTDGHVDWRVASESPLFRRKRAKVLADLLYAQRVLQHATTFVEDEEQKRAITIALRELRKRGLASRVVDLNVCGAVPPYGALLAGKLAALSVASADVHRAYHARYATQTSEIASQLAGRPITREASLCAITTTSLYGVSASQYNRLRLFVGTDQTKHSIDWQDLGLTSGFGTVHLGDATVEALRVLATTASGSRLVNNLFGEGPSPRLRQVRVGLECLKVKPDQILKHNAQRRVYGLLLSDRARDALLEDRPLEPDAPSFHDISTAWSERWLVTRIESAEVRARVAVEGPAFVQRSLESKGTQLTLPFDV